MTDSGFSAAAQLLSQAKDNGGGLELHDVFGPDAENLTTIEAVGSAVQASDALQWCLRPVPLLELQRDDSLVPPACFILTAAGEAFVDLCGTPAELQAP